MVLKYLQGPCTLTALCINGLYGMDALIFQIHNQDRTQFLKRTCNLEIKLKKCSCAFHIYLNSKIRAPYCKKKLQVILVTDVIKLLSQLLINLYKDMRVGFPQKNSLRVLKKYFFRFSRKMLLRTYNFFAIFARGKYSPSVCAK